MVYKVFLVEDEIVTREGIRDNVNWAAAGFEFCGEAANGESALPLIEETKPDVIITDIKMPFMDGLQLSKILRSHMPWVKIIILSGHDEFNFAQSAIKLGITEYLLKPISSADLHKVLTGLTKTLEKEKTEREKLKAMQNSLQDNLVLAQEKFILNLISGGISSSEAMELSLQYGLDIIAKFYLVILIKIEPIEQNSLVNFDTYHQVEQKVSQIAKDDPDIFLAKKDLEEIIFLVKGNDLDQLRQESEFRASLIKEKISQENNCNLSVYLGSPQDRLGTIHRSFAEALIKSKTQPIKTDSTHAEIFLPHLLKLDHHAIETYLKFGTVQEFDQFFNKYLKPTAQTGLKLPLIKQYLFVDIILTVNQYLSDLGIDDKKLIIEIDQIERLLKNIVTIEQIYAEIKKIFSESINLRNSIINNEKIIFEKIQDYIEKHFSNPDLKMSDLAKEFNLSPSYFSAVFKQEVGETFREYLCNLRINQAKDLLSNTNLKSSEIAFHSGYNDPHYFSYIFKKKTGVSPQEFRKSTKGK